MGPPPVCRARVPGVQTAALPVVHLAAPAGCYESDALGTQCHLLEGLGTQRRAQLSWWLLGPQLQGSRGLQPSDQALGAWGIWLLWKKSRGHPQPLWDPRSSPSSCSWEASSSWDGASHVTSTLNTNLKHRGCQQDAEGWRREKRVLLSKPPQGSAF